MIDQVHRLQKLIAAVAAAAAGDVARRLEGEQDLFEELARQLLLLGQLADLEAHARLGPGQGDHRLEGVAGALRNHADMISRVNIIGASCFDPQG